MTYVTIPGATVARIRADAIEEAARHLAANGARQAAVKLRAYAAPYREDEARGPKALTPGAVFRQ